MDSRYDHASDFGPNEADESFAPDAQAASGGAEERRMQVRAYNHWAALLDGRELPSIDDLEDTDLRAFADNSLLIDFTSGLDNPALSYVGAAIRDECGLGESAEAFTQVPARSLLSSVIGHCPKMIADRAPFGFEAEFENRRDETLFCRGVLLPFSSDGETIDFVYGVITWKAIEPAETDQPATAEQLAETRLRVPLPQPGFSPASVELSELLRLADEIAQATALDARSDPPVIPQEAAIEHASVVESAGLEHGLEELLPESEPVEGGSLADRLSSARSVADTVKAGESRTRAALYGALSLAYDFALEADQSPEEYHRLLTENGLKAQARAPMTPIVKLVFGADYDKARLTEFAAALCYARREGLGLGAFQTFIEQQPGGLKALVAAERQARRPEPRPDTKGEAARASLRVAPPITLADIPADDEFALVVTRRGADGCHEPVGLVADPALVERAIRKIG
jgi:hypothetical protein